MLLGYGFSLFPLIVELTENLVFLNFGMGLIKALQASTDASGTGLRFVSVALSRRSTTGPVEG